MDNNTKRRTIYLAKILYELTDEYHPLSTNDIVDILQDKYHIKTNRKRIGLDIKILKQYGMQIKTVRSKSLMYSISSRKYETPAVKLIIGAVASSKTFSEKKSARLFDNISKLTGIKYEETVKNSISSNIRRRQKRANVSNIIDVINNAIIRGKKVLLKIPENGTSQNNYDGAENYVISPYCLVWEGKYYIIGFSQKENNIVNICVNKIINEPQILNEDVISCPNNFDINKYIEDCFNNGESTYKKTDV